MSLDQPRVELCQRSHLPAPLLWIPASAGMTVWGTCLLSSLWIPAPYWSTGQALRRNDGVLD